LNNLTIQILPEQYAILHISSDENIPAWVLNGKYWSITRSESEISIVCQQDVVPTGFKGEFNWKVFKVHNPLTFEMAGILASLANPLADAGISIFAISSYETDYLMLKEVNLEKAVEVLSKAGHIIIH
jgi:hypothetical protein